MFVRSDKSWRQMWELSVVSMKAKLCETVGLDVAQVLTASNDFPYVCLCEFSKLLRKLVGCG